MSSEKRKMYQSFWYNTFDGTSKVTYLIAGMICFWFSFVGYKSAIEESMMLEDTFTEVEVKITGKSTLNVPSIYFLYKNKKYSITGGSSEGFREATIGETFTLEYNEEHNIFRDPKKIYSSTFPYFFSAVCFLGGLYCLIGLVYVLFFSLKEEKYE
jgi:hypothetical protein